MIPKISVIVPVYNAGKYLNEFLKTVFEQSFFEFEIICINDASTDNTEIILRQYSDMSLKMRIVENNIRIGAAASRNKGIYLARAPYFICLDGDDLIDKDLFYELYLAAKKADADLVICESDKFSGDYQRDRAKYSYPISEKYSNETYTIQNLQDNGLTLWRRAPWNRLIRKDFFLRKGLYFQSLDSSNDVFAVDMSMMLAERIIHTKSSRALVHHRIDVKSQISSNRNPLCAVSALEEEYNYLIKNNVYYKYKDYLDYNIIATLISEFQRCRDLEKKKLFKLKLGDDLFSRLGIKNEKDIKGKSLKVYLKKIKELKENDDWCFKESPSLNIDFELYNEKLKYFWSFLRDSNYIIAVFGAGKMGMTFIEHSLQNDIKISYLVDNDEKKQGKSYKGIEIKSYQEVVDTINLVILLGKSFLPELCHQINRTNPKVQAFLMDAYLRGGMEFRDCFI